MAIPSGSGTEVLKRSYVDGSSDSEQTLITGVANHVYTVLSIVAHEMANHADARVRLYIDYNAGGTDLRLGDETVGAYNTFIWNDKIVLTGTDKLHFLGLSSLGTANYDVWCTYIDQDWTQENSMSMSGIIGGAGSRTGVIGQIGVQTGFHTWSIYGSGGGVWTPRSGYTTLAWTKIGKMVHVVGKFETTGSVSGSKSGQLQLSLPFTSADTENSSGNCAGTCSLRRGTNDVVSTPIAIVWENTAYLVWQVSTLDGSGETYVQASDVDATVEGEVGITYFAA